MISIDLELARLVNFGVKHGLVEEADRVYTINRLLHTLGLTEFSAVEAPEEDLDCAAPILERILDWAADRGLLAENTVTYRDLLDTELMACLTPPPSAVIREFWQLYARNKKAATDYYYDLSRATHYIRADRIARDELWTAPTKYGEIVITINLSKPEKDPKAIAAARSLPASGYPKCALCRENEGFAGTVAQAPRGNHRLIPLNLCGEDFFLQYSPYVYYNEHCIVLNRDHIPMRICRATFEKLLDFVGKFPHYFIGSNADLPIVGGSILTHDHYQGGNYEFPMAKAPVTHKIRFDGFEDVDAGLVRWPLSVIRLSSTDPDRLCALSEKILDHWRAYSDPDAEILAFTEENGSRVPHNTITPIARFRDRKYELDLVLRNNRTSPEHPLGIFHPHAEYHHIKKENIGLIEVMGLAVLPARLKQELKEIEFYLQHPEKEEELLHKESLAPHLEWYRALKAREIPSDQVHSAIQQDVAVIFSEILENAGVYKDTNAGHEAFLRFCRSVND